MCLRNLFKCFCKKKPSLPESASRNMVRDLLPSTIGYLSLISASITNIEYDCKHYKIPIPQDTIDDLYDLVLSIEKKVSFEKENKRRNYMSE